MKQDDEEESTIKLLVDTAIDIVSIAVLVDNVAMIRLSKIQNYY